MARKLLRGLVKKGILDYTRRSHMQRDTKARFFLKTPKGG
jgi:hypothetical protein